MCMDRYIMTTHCKVFRWNPENVENNSIIALHAWKTGPFVQWLLAALAGALEQNSTHCNHVIHCTLVLCITRHTLQLRDTLHTGALCYKAYSAIFWYTAQMPSDKKHILHTSTVGHSTHCTLLPCDTQHTKQFSMIQTWAQHKSQPTHLSAVPAWLLHLLFGNCNINTTTV